MNQKISAALLSLLLSACGSESDSGDTNTTPNDTNQAGEVDQGNSENSTTKATWAELIGTWDASTSTEDATDLIYILIQQNGDAVYLDYDAPGSCYDKTTLSLTEQNDGTFKHQDSGIVLTFDMNSQKTSAEVTNNLNSDSYTITKDNKTEAQLTPICASEEAEIPTEETFSNASLQDIIGVWYSEIPKDQLIDEQYTVITSTTATYYDYKGDGIDGVTDNCYEKTTGDITDKGNGNFRVSQSLFIGANFTIQVNETGDTLAIDNTSLNKTSIANASGLTASTFESLLCN